MIVDESEIWKPGKPAFPEVKKKPIKKRLNEINTPEEIQKKRDQCHSVDHKTQTKARIRAEPLCQGRNMVLYGVKYEGIPGEDTLLEFIDVAS